MSRTHLINGSMVTTAGTMAHALADASERAAAAGFEPTIGSTPPFAFDYFGMLGSITTKRLKDDVVLNAINSVDWQIKMALGSMLNDFYQTSRTEPTEALPTFETYGQFLRHIEGLQTNEESLNELGLDVTSRLEHLGNLADMRTQLHAIAAGDPDLLRCRKDRLVNGVYFTPDMQDILAITRMRNANEGTLMQLEQIADDEVSRQRKLTDEQKAVLREQLVEQYKFDDERDRRFSHSMDKAKAASLVMLWNCFKDIDREIDPEADTFYDADERTKLAAIKSAIRAVNDSRVRLVKSNALTAIEKAGMRVEAIALLDTLEDAQEHPIFQTN